VRRAYPIAHAWWQMIGEDRGCPVGKAGLFPDLIPAIPIRPRAARELFGMVPCSIDSGSTMHAAVLSHSAGMVSSLASTLYRWQRSRSSWCRAECKAE